jgi:hypothetical protein
MIRNYVNNGQPEGLMESSTILGIKVQDLRSALIKRRRGGKQ